MWKESDYLHFDRYIKMSREKVEFNGKLNSSPPKKLLGKRKRNQYEVLSVMDDPRFYDEFRAELQNTEAWTRQLPSKEERQAIIGILKLQRENLENFILARKEEQECF